MSAHGASWLWSSTRQVCSARTGTRCWAILRCAPSVVRRRVSPCSAVMRWLSVLFLRAETTCARTVRRLSPLAGTSGCGCVRRIWPALGHRVPVTMKKNLIARLLTRIPLHGGGGRLRRLVVAVLGQTMRPGTLGLGGEMFPLLCRVWRRTSSMKSEAVTMVTTSISN